MTILAIAARELRSLFVSPLAWAMLAVAQGLLAWLFLIQIDVFVQLQPKLAAAPGAPGVTDLVAAPLLAYAAVVLLFLVPLLSMRLLSEEYRSGSIRLLLSSPLSSTEIVLGKYLGLLGFLALIWLMTALMPMALYAGTSLDPGKLSAGLLGLALTLAAMGAVGLYLSSLFRQPATAAVMAFGVLLFLWIADHAGRPTEESGLFDWISLSVHYEFLLRGLVRSSGLIYFLLLILTPLILAVHRLERLRQGG